MKTNYPMPALTGQQRDNAIEETKQWLTLARNGVIDATFNEFMAHQIALAALTAESVAASDVISNFNPVGWYITPTDLVPPFYTEDESRMYREIRNGSIAKPRYDSPPSSSELTVWYGSMPESNGKSNWTAILHRKGDSKSLDGITIDRSEYPCRVQYAADRVRYLLGELVVRPCIGSYDSEVHSGYVAKVHPNEVRQRLEWLTSDAHNAACGLEIGDERTAAFELYEVLRRLQRRGAASHVLSATNPLLVEGLNHPVNPDSWFDCQAIANIEEVDSALRELVEDATGDNGVRAVQAILCALKAS